MFILDGCWKMLFDVVRFVVGGVFFLFVPGFALSWALFPRGVDLDFVERVTLSFAFSVTVVPLVVLLFHQFFGVAGFPIDLVHCLVVSFLVINFSVFVWYIRSSRKPKLGT